MVYALFLLMTLTQALASQTAFVHLFEWRWDDVAQECTDFLGPNGYSAVQVSPPNEHAVLKGQPWYQRYQPVSYLLSSRSGTEAEFAHMVRTCKQAGVAVYVDAVLNHMTSSEAELPTQQGSAGSSYGHYIYPAYAEEDLHHCQLNGNDDILDWLNRYEVQHCELGNLADLKTESTKVQRTLGAYLKRLVDLGVGGFRIDAAKHIPAQDLEAILRDVRTRSFIYQEVIANPSEPIRPSEYFSLGSVTEFRFGQDMTNIFLRGKLSWVNNQKPLGEAWGYLPSSKAIVFVDNHDTQRVAGTLTHKQGLKYQLANILMLAWPYGYPQVMSSFSFQRFQEPPPADSTGRTLRVHGPSGIGCNGAKQKGWVCEHRQSPIAAMVGFRRATASARVSNWWSNGSNQIAFGRGDRGFVAINNEVSPMRESLLTGLPPGTYRDVLQNLRIEVDASGRAEITLKPLSALAIHRN